MFVILVDSIAGFFMQGILAILGIMALVGLYNGVTDGFTLTYHMPQEEDYFEDVYRHQAFLQLDLYARDNFEKEYWKSKGLEFVTTEDINDHIAPVLYALTHHDDTQEKYKGKLIALSAEDASQKFNWYGNISYQGGGVYRVRRTIETEIHDYGNHYPEDIKWNREAHTVRRTYVGTVEAHPHRRWTGSIDMGWKVTDCGFTDMDADDETVTRFVTKYLGAEKTDEEVKEEKYQKRLQSEPTI